MFGNLFEEDEKGDDEVSKQSQARKASVDVPPSPRGVTGLCGLQNQGGTCYLNSLIQTLFMTPEFREGILKLGKSELGYGTDKKTRKIPLQLQQLFAKLLLLDQDTSSTSQLTESFGWSGSETCQQHDVQELNRILFSAVESSLVGTSGENLIKRLYHGTSVTKVICQECYKVSEREENFLDLQMVLTGCGSLEQSLQLFYEASEILDGSNKYRCEACNKLVNATRSAKLRSLPPLLTFSLLRFTYDLKTFERIKEAKKYAFPQILDMKDFCEDTSNEDTIYELYSVVIHRGSCYGGHYHAYIKDMEGMGVWSPPEHKEVKISLDKKVIPVDLSDPKELIRVLLEKIGGEASIDKLCQVMYTTIGGTWSGRYKKTHGSLSKFLKKYPDMFIFERGKVSLENPMQRDKHEPAILTEEKPSATTTNSSEKSLKVENAQHWFDFNDNSIHCIEEDEIEKQFSGRESAYMIFYRRTCDTLKESRPPSTLIPQWLIDELQAQNEELSQSRFEYDKRINEIDVSVYFAPDFIVTDRILLYKKGAPNAPTTVSVDRRIHVKEFINNVKKMCSDRGIILSTLTIHTAKVYSSCLHLYDNLTGRPTSSLIECGVNSGSAVFVWDGQQVDGSSIFIGEGHEPVCLHFVYHKQDNNADTETTKYFSKSTTFEALKKYVSEFTGIQFASIILRKLQEEKCSPPTEPLDKKNSETLQDLGIKDGQYFFVEERQQEEKPASFYPVGTDDSDALTIKVECRCLVSEENVDSFAWPVLSVSVTKSLETVLDLKRKIIATLNTDDISVLDCIVRVDEGTLGLGPPLYEEELLDDLVGGQKLVLERGIPLQQNQIALQYYVLAPGYERVEKELYFEKTQSVKTCLQRFVDEAGLPEKAALIDNEDGSLAEEGLRNGDMIVVEEGRIPPKGFIRLSLWKIEEDASENTDGMLAWMTSRLQGLLAGTQTNEGYRENTLFFVGEIEISQDVSLTYLKMDIMKIDQFKRVPAPEFLRIQEIVNGFPGRVLRKPEETLRYKKLSSSSQLSGKVLSHAEDLSPSAILLHVKRRISGTRTYEQGKPIVFDSMEVATPDALRRMLADTLNLKPDSITMAKYIRHKFQWLVITSSPPHQIKNKRSKKNVNLRHAPYHLRDGDVIGVKERETRCSDNEDFSTEEDDEGRQRLRVIEEEKGRRRRERRSGPQRKPEADLRIHVDDFS